MNERIRELHRQVMLWNDTNGCPYDGEFIVPQEYTQKLAELIIRRCAQAANDWYQNHESLHWDPATHILAEFGVEEE